MRARTAVESSTREPGPEPVNGTARARTRGCTGDWPEPPVRFCSALAARAAAQTRRRPAPSTRKPRQSAEALAKKPAQPVDKPTARAASGRRSPSRRSRQDAAKIFRCRDQDRRCQGAAEGRRADAPLPRQRPLVAAQAVLPAGAAELGLPCARRAVHAAGAAAVARPFAVAADHQHLAPPTSRRSSAPSRRCARARSADADAARSRDRRSGRPQARRMGRSCAATTPMPSFRRYAAFIAANPSWPHVTLSASAPRRAVERPAPTTHACCAFFAQAAAAHRQGPLRAGARAARQRRPRRRRGAGARGLAQRRLLGTTSRARCSRCSATC